MREKGRRRFEGLVQEIFDVQILPGAMNPAIRGPAPDSDGHQQVWLSATPRWIEGTR